MRAAQAGKHVLCEKPCAVSSADLADMLNVCRQSNVQFMDGATLLGKIAADDDLVARHAYAVITANPDAVPGARRATRGSTPRPSR